MMDNNDNLDMNVIKNHGWRVTFAGLGVNLALGILYTWSVISKGLPDDWTATQKSWPYSLACFVFCLIMVPAGRMQDKLGPRLVASIGGILVGAGMIIAGFSTTLTAYMVGFGVLAGAGIGFGYAAATPPAVKWFPSAKTGLIAGLVVSGFGLASVYAAPLSRLLIGSFGLPTTMKALGIAFMIVVVGLAQLLKTPPAGYVPEGTDQGKNAVKRPGKEDFKPTEMLRTWQFYILWFMYACGAGAGLMIISKLAIIADKQAGIKLGFILVAALAIGNGTGRILAGMLSDKLGRQKTMFICFLLQAVLVFGLSRTTEGSVLTGMVSLAVISALVGANYGANLSLFPSITKDYYGLKNFGVNYGLVFTAWGIGGLTLSILMSQVYDKYQVFTYAYYVSAGLLIMAAVTTFIVKAPRYEEKLAREPAE
jgi:OFA family oxalate/formate antiporter-like MFS transporter